METVLGLGLHTENLASTAIMVRARRALRISPAVSAPSPRILDVKGKAHDST